MIGGKLVACNNSDYPVNFHKYSFNVIYDKQDLGVFSAQGMGVLPHSTAEMNGKFVTDDKRVSEMLFLSLDTALSGSGQAARINVDNMEVITVLDTKIIGVIPFSITQQYSGQEFVDMMNQKTNCDD
jgi:hypothetical protein